MKSTKSLLLGLMLVGFSMITTNAIAQRGMGRNMQDNPNSGRMLGQCLADLTPEQETKINELRVKHLAEVTPLRNELGEKRARLRTLQSAEKPDMNAINSIIDEMSALRANIQKKGAAHRVEVASNLTSDQKVLFNAKRGNRMNNGNGMKGKGMRGHGMRNCFY